MSKKNATPNDRFVRDCRRYIEGRKIIMEQVGTELARTFPAFWGTVEFTLHHGKCTSATTKDGDRFDT